MFLLFDYSVAEHRSLGLFILGSFIYNTRHFTTRILRLKRRVPLNLYESPTGDDAGTPLSRIFHPPTVVSGVKQDIRTTGTHTIVLMILSCLLTQVSLS